eukprot:scaffold5078_cov127-Skeletonema_dohrnii-CCMP3373.AAC.2
MMIPSPLYYASSISALTPRIASYIAGYIAGGLLLPRTTKNHHIISCCGHKNLLGLPLSVAIIDQDIDDDNANGGSYVDLGTIITNEADDYDDSFLQNLVVPPPPSETIHHITSSTHINNSMEAWRSNHWIVLIDDEPSIRLAIGDYLHSMGYTMITACDGPQSFLDVLLYSCGWSLLMEDNDGNNDNRPPWMKDDDNDDESMLWRLPNCIISDIRMPGGVDGVQLLELLRHVDNDGKKNSSSGSEEERSSDVKKGKKKGRSKKGAERSNNEYDGKDDFDLLDAIVGSSGSGNNDGSSTTAGKQIVTAIDQAIQKLNVIRDTLTYHQEASNNNQYPTSLLQIPVILLTAKAMVSDRIVGFKAGANNYLPKPFRPEELLGMVDSLLRKEERERKEWMSEKNDLGSSIDDVALEPNNNKKEKEGGGGKCVNELAMYSASAQQMNDLTTELIEIKNFLKEEAQRQTNVKVEQEEMGRLAKLLPNALWMFMNDERRKRLFSSDHIRSILLFCFDDASLAKKSTAKRDDLLTELERKNEKDPDRLKNFLVD